MLSSRPTKSRYNHMWLLYLVECPVKEFKPFPPSKSKIFTRMEGDTYVLYLEVLKHFQVGKALGTLHIDPFTEDTHICLAHFVLQRALETSGLNLLPDTFGTCWWWQGLTPKSSLLIATGRPQHQNYWCSIFQSRTFWSELPGPQIRLSASFTRNLFSNQGANKLLQAFATKNWWGYFFLVFQNVLHHTPRVGLVVCWKLCYYVTHECIP